MPSFGTFGTRLEPLDEFERSPKMDSDCLWCWDFMVGRADPDIYQTCKCSHEAAVHGEGHPHSCCQSWHTGNSNMRRVYCPCQRYVPDYRLTKGEVLHSLSKIMDATCQG